jgi:proteic killer suppression protein
MIKRFSHKGLRDFFDTGRVAGINPAHAGKLKLILAMLKNAKKPEDMRKPNLKLHTLQGNLAGFFSVSVSGNLRVIFRFEGQDITDVDYLDYH